MQFFRIFFIVFLGVGMNPIQAQSDTFTMSAQADSILLSLQKDNILFYELLEGDVMDHKLQKIREHSENHIPPVLFALSQNLYQKGEVEEALYCYYIAELRTRIDIELTDLLPMRKTKIGKLYTLQFGTELQKVVTGIPERVEEILNKAITHVAVTPAKSSPLWLYFDGTEDIAKVDGLLHSINSEKDRKDVVLKVKQQARRNSRDFGFKE